MKEKIDSLFSAVENTNFSNNEKRVVKNDIINNLNLFCDYFTQVVRMEIFCRSVSTWGSSDQYIYSQMDEERRLRHNLCVNACVELNKLSSELGLPDFYNGDINDRHEIAAFCGCIVSNIYLDGISENRTFDELVECFSESENYTPIAHIKEWEMEL